MRGKMAMVGALLALAAAAAPAQEEGSAALGRLVEERQLAFTLKKEHVIRFYWFDPDRRTMALNVAVRGEKPRAVLYTDKGQDDRGYGVIVNVFFSPDYQRMAYIARSADGKDWYVVVDGQEYGKFGAVLDETVTFSADGRRFAFSASKSGHPGKKDVQVICDGREGRKYHSIVGGPPAFNPVTGELVYFAREGGSWFMVKEETEGEKFEQTGFGPVFSADGRRTVYAGLDNGRWYIKDTGTRHGPFKSISMVGFPPGREELYYVATSGQSPVTYVDHKPLAVEGCKWVVAPVISPDGKREAFVASDGEAQFALVDGLPQKKYYDQPPSSGFFSPLGRHYYYDVALTEDMSERLFVMDGRELWTMEGDFRFLDVRFSPEEDRWAFNWSVAEQLQTTVVDSVAFTFPWMSRVVFSPDGASWACTASRKDWRKTFLIVDGQERRPFNSAGSSVAFTPDGSLAYIANEEDKFFLVIGDRRGEAYDSIFPFEVEFAKDGSLTYYGIAGDDVYRVVVQGD